MLTGCGDTTKAGEETAKNEPEVTTLTYSINLKKGADGKYEGKAGEKVTFNAKAVGPDAATVKWATDMPKLPMQGIDLSDRKIGKPQSFTFAQAGEVTIKCSPSMQKNENGKELIKGEESFQIVIK